MHQVSFALGRWVEETKGVNITGSAPSPPFLSSFTKGCYFRLPFEPVINLCPCLTASSWKRVGNFIFFYLSYKKKKKPQKPAGKWASAGFCAKDDYTFSLKYTPGLFIAHPQLKLPWVGVREYRKGLFVGKKYLWGLVQKQNNYLGWKGLLECHLHA